MIYEVKVSFVTIDEKSGNEKVCKERYIVGNALRFNHAENAAELQVVAKEVDVTDIKRSRLKEILNKRTSGDESIWIAEVKDTFTNDDGEEKYNVYKVAFYSTTFDNAKAFITEYLKQGYGDMELISLKKSNFVDII